RPTRSAPKPARFLDYVEEPEGTSVPKKKMRMTVKFSDFSEDEDNGPSTSSSSRSATKKKERNDLESEEENEEREARNEKGKKEEHNKLENEEKRKSKEDRRKTIEKKSHKVYQSLVSKIARFEVQSRRYIKRDTPDPQVMDHQIRKEV
ncbi:hypothetical protein PENTCL1PPCAC_13966, partial [Pristionchus entomophagus]